MTGGSWSRVAASKSHNRWASQGFYIGNHPWYFGAPLSTHTQHKSTVLGSKVPCIIKHPYRMHCTSQSGLRDPCWRYHYICAHTSYHNCIHCHTVLSTFVHRPFVQAQMAIAYSPLNKQANTSYTANKCQVTHKICD